MKCCWYERDVTVRANHYLAVVRTKEVEGKRHGENRFPYRRFRRPGSKQLYRCNQRWKNQRIGEVKDGFTQAWRTVPIRATRLGRVGRNIHRDRRTDCDHHRRGRRTTGCGTRNRVGRGRRRAGQDGSGSRGYSVLPSEYA